MKVEGSLGQNFREQDNDLEMERLDFGAVELCYNYITVRLFATKDVDLSRQC